jgi:hypothetical protein
MSAVAQESASTQAEKMSGFPLNPDMEERKKRGRTGDLRPIAGSK